MQQTPGERERAREREALDVMATTLSGMREPGIYGQRNSRVGKGDGMIEGKRKWC